MECNAHSDFYNVVPLRFLPKQGLHILQKRGIRIGDKLSIFPMQGRKKTITLNRTKYHLISNPSYKVETNDINILLPSMQDDNYSFSLILCSKASSSRKDKTARFLLKSTCSNPFFVNGTLSYETFIERGDVIDLGHNRLKVVASDSDKTIDDVFATNLILNKQLIESDLNILIEGETGTGKTHLAKKIHVASGRVGEFVHINLSSFSPNLIESELFGHIKGAFTGAVLNKHGAFLDANRGTLFLDEVDSLPYSLQTKLLLFLDSKEVRPVGGSINYKTDVRLIFASGRQLLPLVDKGTIRRDFYFRVTSGGTITLPQINKHPEVIKQLCEAFENQHNVTISKKLLSYYQKINWPGNIRQLLGHLNKKKIMGKGPKLEFDRTDEELTLGQHLLKERLEEQFMTMQSLKANYARKVFHHLDCNYQNCAKVLKISNNTLRSLLSQSELAT
ncbi:MAG: sigma 54-interacting transcriptional regulator [Bacteriovoracaceae bacterium]|nr:sigma 54-interacting transcriptional regulator [Bacteriovoracaceae bacterium]